MLPGYSSRMQQVPRPRVLLDDHPEVLTALQRLLAPSCDVVGHVSDGPALLEAAKRLQPDVIVMDVRMPGSTGLETCRQVIEAVPRTKVVVLTAADDSAFRRGHSSSVLRRSF